MTGGGELEGGSWGMEESNTLANAPANKVPSQRFKTTSKEGQLFILSQRHLLGDRHQIAKQLRTQKIQNTKTNLVFGFDDVDYTSDAMMRQKDILKPGAAYNPKRKAEHAQMKKELQQTNFNLGHDAPYYEQCSTLPDPSGHIHEYTGVLNTEVKRMIKKSSIYFGGDEPDYTSNQAGFFQWRGGKVDHNKRKAEFAQMKKALQATSFSFGNDQPQYSSQYKDTFGGDAVQNMSREEKELTRKKSQEIKKDLRHCHYALGYDPADYRTTMMRQFEIPDMDQNNRDRVAALENARLMKAELVRAHIILGNDDEYM